MAGRLNKTDNVFSVSKLSVSNSLRLCVFKLFQDGTWYFIAVDREADGVGDKGFPVSFLKYLEQGDRFLVKTDACTYKM